MHKIRLAKGVRSIFMASLFLLVAIPSFSQLDFERDKFEKIITSLCDGSLKSNDFEKNELQLSSTKIILNLSNGKAVGYNQILVLVKGIQKNRNLKLSHLVPFIEKFVGEPSNKRKVELNYVILKWIEISFLRDQNKMAEANKSQRSLVKYLKTIQIKDADYKRAKIYEATHDLVLLLIKGENAKGIELCKEQERSARKLKDTSLIIHSLYYSCDYYIATGDLMKFIDLSEESVQLDSLQMNKSDYYLSTKMHLVDAYIYEGNHPMRNMELLRDLYNNPDSKVDSYAYFFKYLASLDPSGKECDKVLALLGAKNVLDFYMKVKPICAEELYPNDNYQFLRESSYALENFEFYREALISMEEANSTLKIIYSRDLSKAIAEHEKDFAQRENDIALKNESKLSFVYGVSLVIIAFLLVCLTIMFIRKIRQNRKLKVQNGDIQEKEREKVLLMKELHHRVKNNFQIISSLLSNQIKILDDDKMIGILTDSQARINSMAMTHEKLYESDNNYNLCEYAESLYEYVLESFNKKNFHLEAQIDKTILVDVDIAIPIGLIINELVTNSLKYGETGDNTENQISISARLDAGELELVYFDNGSGLPEGLFEGATSMGLRLIKRLTRQLQGKVVYSDKKYIFRIPFTLDVL